MAILRTLNEFGSECVVLAIEPARQCIAKCTYCFATLNSAVQSGSGEKNVADDGSYERTSAAAFGPDYDPTSFTQWSLRNRLPVGWANTVEPFQNVDQSINILKQLDKNNVPLFVQTKGINFEAVWDRFRPFHDNAVLFVSFPSNDQRVIRAFEPGTPSYADRVRVVDKAVAAGFDVILALSPTTAEWLPDPEPFVGEMIERGVSSVFFDYLHLNRRQRGLIEGKLKASHPVVKDKRLLPISVGTSGVFPEQGFETFSTVYEVCDDSGIDFFLNGYFGIIHGFFNSRPTITDPASYTRGTVFPYHDSALFWLLEQEFFDEPGDVFLEKPYAPEMAVVVRWREVIKLLESENKITQQFKVGELQGLLCARKLPTLAIKSLGRLTTMPEFFRALWNNPSKHGTFWTHPWVRIAKMPSGRYHTDGDGNLVMIFDANYHEGGEARVVEDLAAYRQFEFEGFSA